MAKIHFYNFLKKIDGPLKGDESPLYLCMALYGFVDLLF